MIDQTMKALNDAHGEGADAGDAMREFIKRALDPETSYLKRIREWEETRADFEDERKNLRLAAETLEEADGVIHAVDDPFTLRFLDSGLTSVVDNMYKARATMLTLVTAVAHITEKQDSDPRESVASLTGFLDSLCEAVCSRVEASGNLISREKPDGADKARHDSFIAAHAAYTTEWKSALERCSGDRVKAFMLILAEYAILNRDDGETEKKDSPQ